MIKNKRFYLIILSILFISLVTLLTGCKKVSIETIDKLTLYVGEEEKLDINVTNYKGDVEVKSSNDSIAIVSGETIKALSKGEVVITVTTSGKKKVSKDIMVTVLPKPVVIDKKLTISNIPEEVKVFDKFNLTTIYSIDTSYEVVWSSSNLDILTIDEKGEVTVKSSGKVTVSCCLKNDNMVKDTVEFIVKPQLDILMSDQILQKRQTVELEYLVGGSSTDLGETKWVLLNNTIASIKDNVLKANMVGETTLYLVSTVNDSLIDSIKIKVVDTSISLKLVNDEFYIGDTAKLDITLNDYIYADSENYNIFDLITLTSSNEEIATINSLGEITGLKDGVTYIKVTLTSNKSINATYKLTVLHPLIEDGEKVVEFITTGPGEDSSTMMEINYHTYNTKTYVEYTKTSDTTFTDSNTVTGKGYYFYYNGDLNDTPTTPRNVYRVTLENLEPNTDYMYRINQGDNTYSPVHYFKTASGRDHDTSFIYLADVHYSTLSFTYSGSEVSEKVIQSALKLNPNANLVLSGGDLIDTGGNPAIWDVYYERANSLRSMVWSTTPGNHEYYFSGTSFTDFRFFKAFSASAYNGPSTHIGASCWYLYNDCLFIMIDNNLYTAEQNAWVEEVLSTVDAKWTIATMHAPIERDNTDRDEKLMKIFERHSVDLVLEGHYHGDCYNKNYYEGVFSTNPNLGVTYLTGQGGGVKGLGDNTQADTFAQGYLIDCLNDKIVIKRIDGLGNIISTRELASKKNTAGIDKTNEEIANTFTYKFDLDKLTLICNWDYFYRNVNKVTFIDNLRNEINDIIYIPTPGYTSVTFKNINAYMNYDVKVLIEFIDGTIIEKAIINNVITMNLNYRNVSNHSLGLTFNSADPNLDMMIRAYEIYLNGELHDSIYYLDSDFIPVTSYSFSYLFANTTYEIMVKAVSFDGGTIYQDQITVKTN